MERKYLAYDHLPPKGFGYFVWEDKNGITWELFGSAKDLPKDIYEKWRKESLLPLFKKDKIAQPEGLTYAMPRGITSTAMHYCIAVLFFIEIQESKVSMRCSVAARLF